MPGPLLKETQVEVMFPLEGVDTTRAYMRQRKMTSPAAVNVRSFDPQTDRARGAQRHGLVRYFPGPAVANGAAVQDINHLVADVKVS